MTKKQHKKSNKIKTILLAVLLMFACFFSCFNFGTTFAGTGTNTGGIVSPSDPTTPTANYNLMFKELTEEAGAVYVYVNQFENTDIVYATSINISTDLENLKYINYKLEYIDKTLFSSAITSFDLDIYTYKYLVKNLAVYENSERVYDITSIYRPWCNGDIANSVQTTTEKAFAVEKCYTFLTKEDGTISKSVMDIETIYITDKFVGFVRYDAGFGLYDKACDSHFVAFDTDKQIDTLKEADVYFTTQKYNSQSFKPFGEQIDNYSYLKADTFVSYEGSGIFKNSYSWKRIETVEEFITNVEENPVYIQSTFNSKDKTLLNEETKNELNKNKWVLRFYESDYFYTPLDFGVLDQRTIVGDVSILRLKFETGGYTFEYGAIDDKTTGSKNPVATVGSSSPSTMIESVIDWFKNVFSNFKRILIIILIVALILILFPLIVSVFPAIAGFFAAIFKLILKAITGIINLISKLFGGGKW